MMINMGRIIRIARVAAAISTAVMGVNAVAETSAPVKNIVLVHGYFADGSGWMPVAKILRRDGFTVSVVQNPETSFDDDVKAAQRVVDMQKGPSILVGHSYGGAVVTQAGNDPKVAGLVYVSAFQPDVGESLMTLTKKIPGASESIKKTPDGFLYLDPAHFHADFAADLPASVADFMAASQVMPSVETFAAPISQAAWKEKPSWAVITTADRMVNPELQRFMAKRAQSKVVEIKASHVSFISHAPQVAKLIEQAAAQSGK
jgi:pimeloyl-ACP methyl ester carboxylesterase